MDRETVYQVALALGAVVIFLALLVAVSTLFEANGNLSPTGGLALIGAILVFILVMNGAGLWLERRNFDDDGS